MRHLPSPLKAWRSAALGLFFAILLLGCTPPVLQQAESSFPHTGGLAFLEDGRTTREEVLWRLGTPNAHFEGERILTYALSKLPDGRWARRGRQQALAWGPAYLHPTESLVLFFGPDGRLLRHSLVVAK